MKIPASKTVYWLVKREFWENRGSFLWAPVITGGVMLLLTLMGIITGEVFRMRNGARINGINFNEITANMDADALRTLGNALDLSILTPAILISVVLFVVVFFYCLNSLYEDRRDRSILFWKSLPISDRSTVLSKAICATVLAPAIAILTSVVTGLLILVLAAITASLHGANLWQMLWTLPHPFRMVATMLASIPLYALWALPTVGWLMLCSAWSRSKPFLWALIIPIGSGIIVSWFNLMGLFQLGSQWFWGNVVGRSLLSVFPGGWMRGQINNSADLKISGAGEQSRLLGDILNLPHMYAAVLTPQFLLGAVAGIAMLAGAVWFRRWRDDS